MNTPVNTSHSSRFALVLIALAALTGAAGVILGALAAHALQEPAAGLIDTASRYAIFHALAIGLAAGLFDRFKPGSWAQRLAGLAALLFAAGIVLFSGGLAMQALTPGLYAGTAPVGGTAFIFGWLALAAGAVAAAVRRG